MRGRASHPTGHRARLAAWLLSISAAPVLALALAACTPDPEERAPQCPVAQAPPDAASFTRYTARGSDLTDQLLSGRITDLKGACKGLLGRNAVVARAHIEMRITRGPAAHSRDADVPYIVAVTKKDKLLDRRDYTQHVTFPPNVDTVQVTGDDVHFAFPTHRGLGGADYKIYVLFALSPAELAANQRALSAQQAEQQPQTTPGP